MALEAAGSATELFSIGETGALASHNGVLYISSGGLKSINLSTGQVTDIGGSTYRDLASDGTTLYGMSGGSIYRINTTDGSAVRVVSSLGVGSRQTFSPRGFLPFSSGFYIAGTLTTTFTRGDGTTGTVSHTGIWTFNSGGNRNQGRDAIPASFFGPMFGSSISIAGPYIIERTSSGVNRRVGNVDNYMAGISRPAGATIHAGQIYLSFGNKLYRFNREASVEAALTGTAGVKDGNFSVQLTFPGTDPSTEAITDLTREDFSVTQTSGDTLVDAGLGDFTFSGPAQGTNNYTLNFTPADDVKGTFSIDITGTVTVGSHTNVAVALSPHIVSYNTTDAVINASFTHVGTVKAHDFEVTVDFAGRDAVTNFEKTDVDITRISGATLAEAGLTDFTLSGPAQGTNNYTLGFTPADNVKGVFEIDISGDVTESGRSVSVVVPSLELTYNTTPPALGEARLVGNAKNFGIASGYKQPAGLKVIDGVLYSSILVDSTWNLYSLDTTTGAATLVQANTPVGGGIRNAAKIGNTIYFARSDGLHTWSSVTGTLTKIGTGLGAGITYVRSAVNIDGTLYITGTTRAGIYLFSVNTTTGRATSVRELIIPGRSSSERSIIFGMTEIGNTIYLHDLDSHALYTMNSPTGALTRLGSVNHFGIGETVATGIAELNNVLYMVGNTLDALMHVRYAQASATFTGHATTKTENFEIGVDFAGTDAVTNFTKADITLSRVRGATLQASGLEDFTISGPAQGTNNYTISFTPATNVEGVVALSFTGQVTIGGDSLPVVAPQVQISYDTTPLAVLWTAEDDGESLANQFTETTYTFGLDFQDRLVNAEALVPGAFVVTTSLGTPMQGEQPDWIVVISSVTAVSAADGTYNVNVAVPDNEVGWFELTLPAQTVARPPGRPAQEETESPRVYFDTREHGTWTVPTSPITTATATVRIDFGAVVGGFAADDVLSNTTGVTVTGVSSAGSAQVYDIALAIAEDTDADDVRLSIPANSVMRTPAQDFALVSPAFSVDRAVDAVVATIANAAGIKRGNFSLGITFSGDTAISDFVAGDISLTRVGNTGADLMSSGLDDYTITPDMQNNRRFLVNFTPAENISGQYSFAITGEVTQGGHSRSVMAAPVTLTIETSYPAINAAFQDAAGVKSSDFEIGILFADGTDAVTDLVKGTFKLTHISGATLAASGLTGYTVAADPDNNRRWIISFPLNDNVTGTFSLGLAADVVAHIMDTPHTIVASAVNITFDSRLADLNATHQGPYLPDTDDVITTIDHRGFDVIVNFTTTGKITEFTVANLPFTVTPLMSPGLVPEIIPIDNDDNSFLVRFTIGDMAGIGGGVSGTFGFDVGGEVLDAGRRRNVVFTKFDTSYNIPEYIRAAITGNEVVTADGPHSYMVSFQGNFRITQFQAADIEIERISGSSLADAGLGSFNRNRESDTAFSIVLTFRPHVSGRALLKLIGTVDVANIGTGITILADPIDIAYNTVSELPSVPNIRQIPTIILPVGKAFKFPLDQYIFGDADVVSISASANWMSLTGVDADGVNRELRYAPPSNLSISGEKFDQYSVQVFARGMGGTRDVVAYVYIERPEVSPIDVVFWDLPENLDMGRVSTPTIIIGVVFSRALVAGETLLPSDIILEGVAGVSVSSVDVDPLNDRRYNIALAIAQGSTGILEISIE